MRTALLCLILITALAGCDKDVTTRRCEEFRTAVKKGDKEKLREIVNGYITQSSSFTHTAANLDKLVSFISGHCEVEATVLCFACIKTLPEQSEIRLRFFDGATQVDGVIDLSAHSREDNRMKFVSVH